MHDLLSGEELYNQLYDAREAYDRLHTYTRGALAAYEKDRLRLIAERDKARDERDRAINGLKEFAKESVAQGDEIERLKRLLHYSQDTIEILLNQLQREEDAQA